MDSTTNGAAMPQTPHASYEVWWDDGGTLELLCVCPSRGEAIDISRVMGASWGVLMTVRSVLATVA